MKLWYRSVIRVAVMGCCLVLGGCDEPPREVSGGSARVSRSLAEPPAVAPAGKQTDVASPNSIEQPVEDVPVPGQSVVTEIPAEEKRALDLSLPPQPKVELGSLEGTRMPSRRLLPDLFGREDGDERTLSWKGRVLTNKTGQDDLDIIQGGEITMEMKTR